MALPFLPDMRQRTFKQRSSLDQLTEVEVRKHCGLPLINVKELFELFGSKLEPKTGRSIAIPSEAKLISCLSFFRSGSFQYVEGTINGISQSSFSRILDQFSSLMCCEYSSQFISFPNDVAKINRTKEAFFDIAQFPGILGVIDGSHVPIKAPKNDEPLYVNRKGYHSINVQLVSGPNNQILDTVVKWPGATHDSFMWNNCNLKQRFEGMEFGESWLIGKINETLKYK